MCVQTAVVGMWVNTAVHKVWGGGGGRPIVVGGKDVSVSGTEVQRRWIVVCRTESYPLPALIHGSAATNGPGARRYPDFTIIFRHSTLGRTPLDESPPLPSPLILRNIRFILIIFFNSWFLAS